MKRQLLALAALTAAAGASAQSSSVTLFGVADVSVAHISTSGSGVTGLANGGNSSSRLGFRGVEDLGGGLKAGFWLEAGISVDDGGAALKFDRRSTVGLTGNFGEVRLGRDKTPAYQNLETFHAFADSGMGAINAHNLISSSAAGTGEGSAPKRRSNSISYLLPQLGGVYGQASYSFGEVAGSHRLGTGAGIRLGYANGPLNVAVAYHLERGGAAASASAPASSADYKAMNIGALYKLGSFTPMVLFASERGAGKRVDVYSVGLKVALGGGELRAAYTRFDDKKTDNDSDRLALGYGYQLSKRTEIYGAVARLNNDGAATRKLGSSLSPTPAAGRDLTGYEIGLRHNF